MKTLKSYLYMTKIQLLMALTYTSDFVINLFVQILLLFVTVFFWKAAYQGIDSVAEVNQKQMLIYSIMTVILRNLFSYSVENNIRSRIRMGNVAVDFIKPVNIFYMYFFEDFGKSITALIQTVIPILLVSSLFVVVPMPASLPHFLLFLISVVFSYLLLWLTSAIFGLLYFWFIDMGPLGSIKDNLVKLLSGMFVPIWFFPLMFQKIMQFLPFIYTFQLPLSIYIGRSTWQEALQGLVIQIIWILLFGLLFQHMRKKASHNIMVQGG